MLALLKWRSRRRDICSVIQSYYVHIHKQDVGDLMTVAVTSMGGRRMKLRS